MKTLKQILLESEYQFGLDLKDNINVKKLKPLIDPDEIKFIDKAVPVNIFKFTMTKKPLVTIDGKLMDPDTKEDIVKTFRDTVENAIGPIQLQNDTALLVTKDTKKNRIWYFIEINKNNKIGKNNPILIKDILAKFHDKSIIIENYKGNSYYLLSGAYEAWMDEIDAKTDQQDLDDAKQENRQKWNDWIPQIDYENGKIDREHINRIRKLVGDKSVNDEFDDTLETNLKAWQKQFGIPETGKWDNASQEKAIQILQDRPYENLNAEIETYSALKKPIDLDIKDNSLNDLVALAKNYRQWANSSEELQKKYGSKSVYKLNSTYVKPANDYFKKSYAAGREEFEAAGGMDTEHKAKAPKAKIDKNGNTILTGFKKKS
jgi:hypothetical protein